LGEGMRISDVSNLRAIKPGFQPSQFLTLDLALPRAKYADLLLKQQEFFERLDRRLRTLPGVEAAGGVTPLPFSGNDRASSFWIAGRPDPGSGNHPNASHLTLMGDYFRAMHIPLLTGRAFDSRYGREAMPVVRANESFVKKFVERPDAGGPQLQFE